MKLSGRQKKWGIGLLVFLGICAVAIVTIFYLAVYHFKEIARIGIYEETDGRYSFEASHIDLSVFSKRIIIKNAAIVCNDTLHADKHYTLHIPEIYLSIGSWTDLIFLKKMEIDSLAIALPDVVTHVHKNEEREPVSLDVSDVFDGVYKLTSRLQIHAMHIKSGAYRFSNISTGVALEANDFNLYIKNFGSEPGVKKIFGAEDVDISMNKQHWRLPDGIREISFKKFHFSGKNQFFELDSCTFLVKPGETKKGVLLTADKFFFNSGQLQNIYLNDELHLDTLLCLNPVLKILPAIHPSKDSVKTVSSALHSIFNKMSFGYIDVTGGQFILNNAIQDSTENVNTIKTDLKIYHLTTDHNNTPHLNADSIKLKLNSLILMTKDSMNQLSINEFAITNNDVILLNTKFGPTKYNHLASGINFTTPSLRIKNCGLEDLLEKRIGGTLAELQQPVISLVAKNKVKKMPGSAVKSEGKGMEDFYQALHNLNELIVVDSFRITDGTVIYIAPQKASTLEMKKMNATILLNKFLQSDSLIDIKRSMPDLRFGQITARTPKLHLQLDNYSFDGSRRHNHAKDFHLQLSGNTVLSGNELYWEILDWDLLANKNIIQIEYLQIGELKINRIHTKQAIKTVKDLPVINIGRMDIGHLSLDKKESSDNSFSLQGDDICADNIHSKKQFLTWSNAQGNFTGIHVENNTLTARLKEMIFYNGDMSAITGAAAAIKAEKGSTDIKAPLLKLNITISSTDFSNINLSHFHLYDPEIILYKKRTDSTQITVNKRPFTIPLNLQAANFSITNAAVSYSAEKEKDTMYAHAKMSIHINDLVTFKKSDQPVSYKKTVFIIDSARFIKGNAHIQMPHNEIILTNGKISKEAKTKISLQTGALINWQNINVQTHSSDSTGLTAENISGFFHDLSVSIKPGEKIQLQSLLDHTNISEGKIDYRGKNINIQAASIAWQPVDRTLQIHSYSILPKLSRDSIFKTTPWQTDYITIEGALANISGIELKRNLGDTSFSIKKILLNEVMLHASRDKRMPFKHGIEKLMPTKLLAKIKSPLQVDSVEILQSNIHIHEISPSTNTEGIIPLQNAHAIITNIHTRPGTQDELGISFSADLGNMKIHAFKYAESYSDSLSAFRVQLAASGMAFSDLNAITVPLASAKIEKGNADTLFATWKGNKYAAYGQMDFYYNGIKVKLMNPKDSTRPGIKYPLINWVANTFVLRKNNQKTTTTFFVRDLEKFVFNYWIKTCMAGVLTSTGVKSNRKYEKQYNLFKQNYTMPATD